jgi:hypothetical protein
MEDPILSEMLFGSLKSAGKGPSAWGWGSVAVLARRSYKCRFIIRSIRIWTVLTRRKNNPIVVLESAVGIGDILSVWFDGRLSIMRIPICFHTSYRFHTLDEDTDV